MNDHKKSKNVIELLGPIIEERLIGSTKSNSERAKKEVKAGRRM